MREGGRTGRSRWCKAGPRWGGRTTRSPYLVSWGFKVWKGRGTHPAERFEEEVVDLIPDREE